MCDTQDFDMGAINHIGTNPNHYETDLLKYNEYIKMKSKIIKEI